MAQAIAEQTISFFDLSRELRDMIYLELPTKSAPTKIIQKWYLHLRAHVRGLPIPQLLAVSKGFAHEYKEATMKRAVLQVDDHIRNIEEAEIAKVELSTRLASLSKVELNMVTGEVGEYDCNCEGTCCVIGYALDYHSNWANPLVSQMSHGQLAVVVNLHVDPESVPEDQASMQALLRNVRRHAPGIMPGMDGIVINVVLTDGVGGGASGNWDYSNGKIAATWSQMSGNIMDAEVRLNPGME